MIKAIDFFCGTGGLTRALTEAGIDVVAGIYNDSRVRDTYERNNPKSRFYERDVSEVEIEPLREELKIGGNDTTLYVACTPCQPFSTLNPMKSGEDRKYLLLDFVRIVEESPPDFIIVENVPGLSTARGRDVYEQFSDTLVRCGFEGVSPLSTTAKHGLGQPTQTMRRRSWQLITRRS